MAAHEQVDQCEGPARMLRGAPSSNWDVMPGVDSDSFLWWLRVSAQPYNTLSDYERPADALLRSPSRRQGLRIALGLRRRPSWRRRLVLPQLRRDRGCALRGMPEGSGCHRPAHSMVLARNGSHGRSGI